MARRACQALSRAAVPFLFDTLHIARNLADLERANDMCARFGPYVKIMVYGTTSYLNTSFDDFVELLDLEPGDESGDESAPDLLPVGQLYNTLADEAAELLESGQFFRQLCQMLHTLPNLQEVCLTNKSRLRGECECRQAAIDAGNRFRQPIPNVAAVLEAGSVVHDTCIPRGRGLK